MDTADDFEQRYRAVSSRDARFDGQFYTAVHSTGIYCRPSCPARTPLRKNVSFYVTSAAAHSAGFRACKRCLPEATPGSPAWNLRSDAAARAMRLIALGAVDRDGVGGLAATLGYSTRQLGRILQHELGAGPLTLARAQRAATARTLLTETRMPVTDVAFAAGFASVRQFSDTMQEVFALTATEVRRRGNKQAAGAGITMLLPARAPADLHGVLDWFAARALPGVETVADGAFARVLRVGDSAAWFRAEPSDGALKVTLQTTKPDHLVGLISRIRRLFDLDADPAAIDGVLGDVAELRSRVAARPGIRLPGATDPGELLIRTMVGQQISVAAARTHLTRLVAALGETVTIADATWRLFPTMAAIAEHGAEVLTGPARRMNAITAVAARLASGELTLTEGDDPIEQRRTLMAQPGIGAWTADYVSMRVLSNPNVLLTGDVALRTGVRLLGIDDLEALTSRVSPWASYASMHLWRAAADHADTKTTKPKQRAGHSLAGDERTS